MKTTDKIIVRDYGTKAVGTITEIERNPWQNGPTYLGVFYSTKNGCVYYAKMEMVTVLPDELQHTDLEILDKILGDNIRLSVKDVVTAMLHQMV